MWIDTSFSQCYHLCIIYRAEQQSQMCNTIRDVLTIIVHLHALILTFTTPHTDCPLPHSPLIVRALLTHELTRLILKLAHITEVTWLKASRRAATSGARLCVRKRVTKTFSHNVSSCKNQISRHYLLATKL